MRVFEGKTREDGLGHRQDAWAVLREKFDDCSREAVLAAHLEIETVKVRSDEDPDYFLCKKDRCRERLNAVTPREGPSDGQFEDIILQCLPPEYDRIHQAHFEMVDCSLSSIRRMMSKIYADNHARPNSNSSRGIMGHGVATDNGTARSEADTSRIGRNPGRATAERRGEVYGAHTTRPPPTEMPIVVPGRQTGPTATLTSPKSVLRVFLGSAACGIFLCETTPTRSAASHPRQERSSLQRSPPKPK